jgi:hypothetical protein
MKCLICGEKTESSILCQKHNNVDSCLKVMTVHTCGSFSQKTGEETGICENYLLCAPIKSALKHEPFITSGLGHIICPYPSQNLRKAIKSDLSENELSGNYRECKG